MLTSEMLKLRDTTWFLRRSCPCVGPLLTVRLKDADVTGVAVAVGVGVPVAVAVDVDVAVGVGVGVLVAV